MKMKKVLLPEKEMVFLVLLYFHAPTFMTCGKSDYLSGVLTITQKYDFYKVCFFY